MIFFNLSSVGGALDSRRCGAAGSDGAASSLGREERGNECEIAPATTLMMCSMMVLALESRFGFWSIAT